MSNSTVQITLNINLYYFNFYLHHDLLDVLSLSLQFDHKLFMRNIGRMFETMFTEIVLHNLYYI